MLGLFLTYLLLYKYLALFLLVAVAALGVPLPASMLLVAAGAFAVQGYFDIKFVLLAAFLGCVLGDSVGYGLSSRYGQAVLIRIGLGRIFRSRRYLAIEKIFDMHSGKIIFLSRFLVSSVGPAVNVLSGIAWIKARRFYLAMISGEAVYVLMYCTVGYVLGSEWEEIINILENLGVIIGLSVLLGLGLIYYQWRRMKNKRLKRNQSPMIKGNKKVA
ncbi:MAG: DedA family protein [Candidatus Falkowbacteria bacterium]